MEPTQQQETVQQGTYQEPQQAQQPQQQQVYQQPVVDLFDHTADYSKEDVSDGKVFAMLPYLLGFFGVFFAAIIKKENPYVAFHVREGLKLCVVEILLGIVGAVLSFTFIVPIAAAVCIVIVFVLQIIAFFHVCGGKAKEPSIIRSFAFLK